VRVYSLLLHLYPAAFRAEYGDELRAVFAQRRREAGGSMLAVVALWLTTIADVVTSALQTHWDIARQDIRYAARMLARSKGFTCTAILVSALGIGANTAVFSITDHVLVRPLPFADASRLVTVFEDRTARGYPRLEPSPANYRDWKALTKSFDGLAAHRGLSVNMVGEGDPERIEGAAVSAELLPMLGVSPVLGRFFTAADDQAGSAGTLILSHRLWVQRFAANPSIVGHTLLLDGERFTIIGVMPRQFFFPRREALLWIPMRFRDPDFADRDNHYLRVLGKLRPGVSIDQARAELHVIATRLARQYPKELTQVDINTSFLRDDVAADARLMLMALVGASMGVLLIACTNLANLLLARALVRRKELALRAVLGAGRERLVRQFMTEHVLLALGGGVLGTLVAVAAMPLLVRLVPNSLPIADTPALDLRVFAIAAGLTLLTGIGFGMLPALRARDADVSRLQEGQRAGVGGRREHLRAALIVVAITSSVTLSISAGLLIRALWRLQATDMGFRTDHVLTLRTSLPMPEYGAIASRERFYSQVIAGVQALPNVTHTAYVSFLPMVFRGGIFTAVPEGQAPADTKDRQSSVRFVTPGYFAAMGIPLRSGRDVRESDTQKSPFVAVVSASFVRQHWPNQDPLGRRFTFMDSLRTIVGVVGDVHVRGIERTSEPQVYLPEGQVEDNTYLWFAPKDLVIRTASDAGSDSVLAATRQIIARADPQQPISDVRPLADIVSDETATMVASARVLGAFTAIAFLLAGIGIHGLLSFAVSQRSQEIGVRMAMGAQARDILRMVLGRSLQLAVIGIALGISLAHIAARSLESLLAGVTPWDPLAFATGILVALVMTLAGSAVPAARAVRVDPMSAIRSE
jgi:predicted permease